MSRALAAVLLPSISLFACAEQPDYAQLDDPYVFDGVEIEQLLREDPDAIFEVDMVDAATYRFDQREAAIDFERVFLRTPGHAPVALSEVADRTGIDIAWPSWSLSRTPQFRAETLGDDCSQPESFYSGNVKLCYCADVELGTGKQHLLEEAADS